MDNRRKRKLTFSTIGLLFLLSGVEYGEIKKCHFYPFYFSNLINTVEVGVIGSMSVDE